ncbi:MAG: diguanylate cyclase/phosphodiesterase [Firmicutes bacterium]|nr:diguanylate cyclase/phosphodiesterase [Bacillota bacterium]
MFNSMRNKIITAFVIVATVPLILLAFFVYQEMEKALEKEMRESTSKEMIQMDRAMIMMLDGIKEDCQYLATNSFVEAVDTVDTFYNTQEEFVPPGYNSVHEKIYQELERYGQLHPEIAYAYLGTEKGGFIGWPRRSAQKGLAPRKRPWYKPAIENQQETFLSEPYKTYDGSKFTVTASHFVRNFDGKVIGVLGLDVSLDQFTRKFSEIKIGKTGYVFMLAKDGTIMAHPNREFWGHNITELATSEASTSKGRMTNWNFPEYQRLLAGSNTYFETMIEGQRCFVNIQNSSMKNWTLVTVISAEEIAGRAKKISILLVGGTLALIIMILFLIPVVSYQLTRRMDELVKHLNHMAGGDFSERLPDKLLASHDEIGGVAKAIDFMQVSRQHAEWELQASNEELTAIYGQLAATEAELRVQLEQLNIKTKELAQSEERYRHLAYHDILTGLANRLSFLEKLSVELDVQNDDGAGALLFIDLDNFKMINDSMGHDVGDQFLQRTANALKKVAQEQFVARLGGDEFIIILSDETDRQAISEFAQNLIQMVGDVCISSHDPLAVTLSIGIALYPDDGRDVKSLLKNADIAMQCAKKQGKHRYEFFSTDMETDIIHKMGIEAGLRKALKNGEFVLHYQPIVDADKKLVALEALIRWQSPEYGFVSPAQFIPIAEESNLIVEIGEWVLKTACLFGKRLHDAGLTDVNMSVNVSVKEWLQDDFIDKVASVLEKTEFSKDYLVLEILETMLIENLQNVNGKICNLKEQGIKISLDDFGTGYSSLTYLGKLPVNTIKIDKSFIDVLLEKGNYAAIVETVIQLAHKMGFDVVAEGIETAEQLSFLQELKCDKIQGYFISRPLPEEKIWEKYCKDVTA